MVQIEINLELLNATHKYTTLHMQEDFQCVTYLILTFFSQIF
jgi:hypothetical protein